MLNMMIAADVEGLIVFGVVVLIIIAFVVYAYIKEQKRTEAWEATAGLLGFAFSKKDAGLVSRLRGMKIFSQGHSHGAKNVMSGDAGGIEVVICDYEYTTGGGKNSTTHRSAVCMLSSDSLSLPHCFMRRQSRIFDFLGKLFGGQDIDFEEDKTFSDMWVLQGENEYAVRETFTPEVRSYFVNLGQASKQHGLQFEAKGDTLVVYYGTRVEPQQQEAEKLISQAFEILNVFN